MSADQYFHALVNDSLVPILCRILVEVQATAAHEDDAQALANGVLSQTYYYASVANAMTCSYFP